MAGLTMDLSPAWNSANCVKHDDVTQLAYDDGNISTELLNHLIEKDLSQDDFKSLSHPWEDKRNLTTDDVWCNSEKDFYFWGYRFGPLEMEEYLMVHNSNLGKLWNEHSDHLPEAYSIMVNPTTCTLVTDPFIRIKSPETSVPEKPVVPRELPKPYHPSLDHDYLSMKEGGESKRSACNVDIFSEDEPDVEVWEIEDFRDQQTSLSAPVPEQLPVYRPTFKKEARRSSARTAEIRRREQARKISNAVHAVLKTGKVRNTRTFKNIKPKNSVETTPSQSDIEEFYSQPVRQTYTRTTKKKTCKGRIDHSESERHRREILRKNFSFLCDLIPNEYLRGDKVSSQISKQKILNGAKSYIIAVHSAKSSYKTQHHHNRLLREQWQKIQARLLKSIKRQK